MNAIAKIEEWRPVDGYPYEVSSEGRVRRGHRNLKPRVHSNGYLRVCFSVKGKHIDKYIHRLVASAFLGTPNEEMHADHINGDRKDNRLANLRWLTPTANRELRNFATGERNGRSRHSKQLIKAIKSQFGQGKIDRLIAEEFGVARRFVTAIRNERIWRHV